MSKFRNLKEGGITEALILRMDGIVADQCKNSRYFSLLVGSKLPDFDLIDEEVILSNTPAILLPQPAMTITSLSGMECMILQKCKHELQFFKFTYSASDVTRHIHSSSDPFFSPPTGR